MSDTITKVESTIVVTSETGVRFRVRLIRDGDTYGLDDCLVVGSPKSVRLEGEGPFVEFYDTRYEHTRFGQFVSRYGVDTILGLDQFGTGKGGIHLVGYVDEWRVDATAMDVVRAWLWLEVSRGTKEAGR